MKEDLKEKIKKLPFVSLKTLRAQEKRDILPFLKYQKKKGKILRLKKGVYVSKSFVEGESLQGKNEIYLEFLANKLVQPSYLSLRYILAKYSLISEAVYGLTSITLKTPRQISNDVGSFSYRKIKDALFCGYLTNRKENYVIQEATKSKALFDFLYFQKRGLKKIDRSFIEELRLNLEEMSRSNWQEFEEYIKISGSKKMRKISKLINPYAG